jgi:hypothetical protein
MAPIGAKTHRIFLCFLLLNAMGMSYYFVNQTRYCVWIFRLLERRLQEYSSQSSRPSQYYSRPLVLWLVFAKKEAVIIGMTFLAFVVASTLWFFIIQQCWYISKNQTQIELDKIDALKEKWEEAKENRTYVHTYDRGFVQNWREFLFPPVIEEHEPLDYTAEIAEWERKQREKEEKQKKPRRKLD